MSYTEQTLIRRQKKQKQKQKQKLFDPTRPDPVNPDWAGLPGSILEDIIERLSLLDCLSLSKVCRSWRSLFSPELSSWETRGFPSLLMSGQRDRSHRTCVGVLEKRAWDMDLPEARGKYCWGSVNHWLVLVDHVEHFSLDIVMFNPFTKREIFLPRTWDFYHKIVVSGVPDREGVAFMLVSFPSREVRFWVNGSGSWSDHKLAGGDDPFVDAVSCDGTFFLLTKDDDLFQIEPRVVSSDVVIETSFRKVECQTGPMSPGGDARGDGVSRYLVESRGRVLLVLRYFNSSPGATLETKSFEVYCLDVDDDVAPSWTRVEDLGDRVLFLGKCSSRAFSSRELVGGGEMGNCIYFSNDNDVPWWNEWHSCPMRGMSVRFGLNNSGRRHWGVFRLGKKGNEKFCFRGDRDNSGPVWFTAPLWWYCNNFSFH